MTAKRLGGVYVTFTRTIQDATGSSAHLKTGPVPVSPLKLRIYITTQSVADSVDRACVMVYLFI